MLSHSRSSGHFCSRFLISALSDCRNSQRDSIVGTGYLILMPDGSGLDWPQTLLFILQAGVHCTCIWAGVLSDIDAHKAHETKRLIGINWVLPMRMGRLRIMDHL